MGKLYKAITPELADWLGQQRLFFVATAPLAGDGLVNCSPKGMDTFRILGPREVAYLDLTGSGIETVAHLRANGRITNVDRVASAASGLRARGDLVSGDRVRDPDLRERGGTSDSCMACGPQCKSLETRQQPLRNRRGCLPREAICTRSAPRGQATPAGSRSRIVRRCRGRSAVLCSRDLR